MAVIMFVFSFRFALDSGEWKQDNFFFSFQRSSWLDPANIRGTSAPDDGRTVSGCRGGRRAVYTKMIMIWGWKHLIQEITDPYNKQACTWQLTKSQRERERERERKRRDTMGERLSPSYFDKMWYCLLYYIPFPNLGEHVTSMYFVQKQIKII